MTYLLPEQARLKLIESGLYTDLTAPQSAYLEIILESIRAIVDGWMGQSLIPRQYTEVVTSGVTTPFALLSHYPIISIASVVSSAPGFIGSISIPVAAAFTGMTRTVSLGYPRARCQVTYTAGYQPLPDGLSSSIFGMLIASLKTKNPLDLSWLNAPVREVQSFSLPGGLSKTFSNNGQGKSDAGIETQVDRFLAPFAKYRKSRLVTVGGQF